MLYVHRKHIIIKHKKSNNKIIKMTDIKVLLPDTHYRINCDQILTKKIKLLINNYNNDIYEIAKRVDPLYRYSNFYFVYGDDTFSITDVNFCKARQIGDDKKKCLHLNTYRHFNSENLSIAHNDNILFENKIPKAIWRGATTKCKSRFDLIDLWANNNKYIDVGFSEVNDESAPKYEVKNILPVSEMIKYKYLLVLEGNDVASSFVWSFLTNSIVIMPKPKYEMITGQGQVISGYHYIEIKDDTTDLEEKIIWCESHIDECKQIIENKKKFINDLLDNDLYETSARLIENNIVPYIDKYGLTVAIFYKLLLGRYVEDTLPRDHQPLPASLFNSIKNSSEFKNKNNLNNSNNVNKYDFCCGIISINKNHIIPNTIKNQCGFDVCSDKHNVLQIDTNKIISNYRIDYVESLTETTKMCLTAKIKPSGIFIINNVFYIYDYKYDYNITMIDIYKILKNEFVIYSSNNYNKLHNEYIGSENKSTQSSIRHIDVIDDKVIVFTDDNDFYTIVLS
ncbi:MAG: lipopolysaccharide protein [Terrestrivirus sp.]|uniref:Lipopolysaccharide protein n=1 Tax=Terrestrivirus sp. TaxID=2487775 RepID=A0A3G4ZKZ7_9VIRU|nr:MAG: lipopolysaccharide protein [Terrestrivirus sp.]